MHQLSAKTVGCCLGLDLGDVSTSFCILDEEGLVLREGAVPSTQTGFVSLLDGVPPMRVIMESTTATHWVSKTIRSLGHTVIVTNPRRFDLITKSLRKTDRNDAHMLARIGRLDVDLLQPVHERSDVSLRMRALLNARSNLVRMRTRLISQVRCAVKVFGHRVPSCSPESFHVRAKLLLAAELRPALQPLLEVLEALKQAIRQHDAEIARIGQEFPATRLFEDIHGVGPVLALSFVASIEDPRRFKSSRAVGAFLGLTPASRQSGNSNPRLGITKQGDDALRSLLVTAATHILRRSAPDSDLKRYGRKVAAGGTPRDKGRARIAVARKLAIVMHRMWITGEVYTPLQATTDNAQDD